MGQSATLVQGGEVLMQRFGGWPSFHDAEVVSLELQRASAVLIIHVYVFQMLKETDERGFFRQQNHSLVAFRFTGVEELELHDFNEQNVIAGLDVERVNDKLKVVLHPCYGLNGQFVCVKAEAVSVEPCEPPERS